MEFYDSIADLLDFKICKDLAIQLPTKLWPVVDPLR